MPKKGCIIALLLIGLLAAGGRCATLNDFIARSHTTNGFTVVYKLFIPVGYDHTKRYPLILTLHGVGERGNDNNRQLDNEIVLPWIADSNQQKHPCFIVSPQCPAGAQWANFDWSLGHYKIADVPLSNALRTVTGILDSLKKEFSLDTTRFYVCGLSMGGCGTWDIIGRYPDIFAAAVPVCGVGDSSAAVNLSKTPIWAFHGALDLVVPTRGSQQPMASIEAQGNTIVRHITKNDGTSSNLSVAQLKSAIDNGANHIYTEFSNDDHDCWYYAWRNPLLPGWLFSKTKVNGTSTFVAPRKIVPVIFRAPIVKTEYFTVNGSRLLLNKGNGCGIIIKRTTDAAGMVHAAVTPKKCLIFPLKKPDQSAGNGAGTTHNRYDINAGL